MKKESKNMSLASRNSARWRNNPFYRFHKGSKKRRESISEAAKNVDFTPDVATKELNDILWNEDGTLKKEIKAQLLKIAKEFYEFLDIDTKLSDITITGSMANHNWTEYSDIDLHLLIDFSKIDANKDFVRDLMDMKKALWGLRHDIKIKDHDVELYAQGVDDEHHSSGVYSIKNDEWIAKPTKESVKVDTDLVRKKADCIATMIDSLEGVKDDDEKIERVNELKEKISKMRQAGLEDEGEYSPENLAFKVLRNTGYLDTLSDMKVAAMDSMLSLDENDHGLDEEAVSKKQQKFFGIVRALQTGDIKPSKASAAAKKAAKEMDPEDVLDFAETDHDGLPEEVKEDKIPGGKADSKNLTDFDPDELSKGIKHELEHTSSEEVAKEIAMDHLVEDPEYYTHLEKMEKDVKDEKETSHKYEYGCLMVNFDMPTWESKILSKIDEDDLYTEGEDYGLEDEPHVTILFGFHDSEVDIEDIKKEVDENLDGPIKARIKGVSIFENPKYDVLKMDVEGEDLTRLNGIMRDKFPYTNNFPDYHAHMTIAYLKPGTGKKYVTEFSKPIEIESEEMFYSQPNGDQTFWIPNHETFNRQIKFNRNNGPENRLTVMSKEISPERIFYIKDFTQFVCDNIHMENPIHLFLRYGRDEYIHTTASYVPSENTNHINCKGRALVDICRSIAHELTHNRQREIEKFIIGQDVPNIGGEIENEADSVAGMLIKRYTHDNGHEAIYDL